MTVCQTSSVGGQFDTCGI